MVCVRKKTKKGMLLLRIIRWLVLCTQCKVFVFEVCQLGIYLCISFQLWEMFKVNNCEFTSAKETETN